MKVGDEVFVGYPSAVQFEEKGAVGSTKGGKPINHLLWGDWARVNQIQGDWVNIRSRNRNGWLRQENLQPNRILEVNFVDVGQGDGCHIQTAEDKAIVDGIDAESKLQALRTIAVLPLIMLLVYIGLWFYFRSKGGYKPVVLDLKQ